MEDTLLLLDLGNSRLKWARWIDGRLQPGEPLSWREGAFGQRLEAAWRPLSPPGAVVASLVGPQAVQERVSDWIADRWGQHLHRVRPRPRGGGLICAYDDPDQLGADRWAAMVAARRRYPRGSLVVDCGTALTLDALKGEHHLGGYILPGIEAQRATLWQGTAIGPRPEASVVDGEWGTNTRACIELGTVRAVVALIEWALERLQVAGVCDPELVITGGGAPLLLPFLQLEYRLHHNLVLEGIRDCYDQGLTT